MINVATAYGLAPKYKLEIADTIKDLNGQPHRMIKMRITGALFEHKDSILFVRTRNGAATEFSWMTEIAENNQAIYGYFPVDFMPGDVEFGYGDKVIAVFKKARWDKMVRLTDELIEKEVTTINQQWLKQKKEERKRGM